MKFLQLERKDVAEFVMLLQKEFSAGEEDLFQTIDRILKQEVAVFKLVKGGKILGFIEIEEIEEGVARLGAIVISPGARNKGFGKALVSKAIEHLRGENINQAILHVRQENTRAKKLYSQLGFTFSTTIQDETGNLIDEFELDLNGSTGNSVI